MKRYFITYGDKNYEDQKVRICQEALATGKFDEVIAFGPEYPFSPNIRKYIDNYPRGGGFWLWKPIIIRDMLRRLDPGDILVYADAGCSIYNHKDLTRYFNLLSNKSLLLFHLTGKIGKWCSKRVYKTLTGEEKPKWLNKRVIMATVIIAKKSDSNTLIEQWGDTAENHPELFADDTPEERSLEPSFFRDHRHDQSVLNVLYHNLPADEKKAICIQPQRVEYSLYGGQAFLATRISTVLNRTHHVKRKGPLASFFIRLFNI